MGEKTATLTKRIGDRMSRTNFTSRVHGVVYRLSRGRIGSELEGKQVLLLTTEGRRSKKRRTVPLMYMRDGDRMLLVGSNAADIDHHPAWWHNLRANPRAEVRLGRISHDVWAGDLADEERDEWWPRLTEYNPRWEGFQLETERRLPVVALQFVPASGAA